MIWPYIKEISTLEWKTIEFDFDDIVVFVWANNSWKTTILNEIYSLYTWNNKLAKKRIIDWITLDYKGSLEEIKKRIIGSCILDDSSTKKSYRIKNHSIDEDYLSNEKFERWLSFPSHHHLFFIDKLNTENRLTILGGQNRRTRITDVPMNLYHSFVDEITPKMEILSKIFFKVFGKRILFIPSYHWNMLEFKVSDTEVKELTQNDWNEYDKQRTLYNKLPSINRQWDWMKSFTWIISTLIESNKNTYIIDEPESFLHPPQANMLGQELLKITNSQLFLASHSQDFIKWLIKSSSEKLRIIKVTRIWNQNYLNEIDKEDVLSIQKDPFLHYSNYLDWLFTHLTVICEDYSDCLFYNRIFDLVLSEEWRNDYSLNFVHTWWKNRFWVVNNISKKIWLNFVFLADVDLLNNYDKLLQFVSQDFKTQKRNRNKLSDRINEFWETIIDYEKLLIWFQRSFKWKEIKQSSINKIEKYFKKFKKPRDHLKYRWERIFNWDVPEYYYEITQFLESHNFYVNPYWEMESLISSIEEKKWKRVNKTFEIDDNSQKLRRAKSYIKDVLKKKWLL